MIDWVLNPLPKTKSVYRLTRAKEHLPFVIPTTLLGGLVAARAGGATLDWTIAFATAANVLAVTFAFMINDIEDAPDDSYSPARAARNPIASGELSGRTGYLACGAVVALSLVFYLLAGVSVFVAGAAILGLSLLYSWRRFRLKAWPVIDVLSHSLMLGGLLFAVGMLALGSTPMWGLAVAAGVTSLSAYGQLYNQLRDFEGDQHAGLRTSAVLLGRERAQIVMYSMVLLTGTIFLAAFARGVLPIGLGAVLLAAFAASLGFKSSTDARGTVASDLSGRYQSRGLLALNIAVVSWVGWILLNQLFPFW
jgi:4-hydroxybenzoate polyprenyltransferase